jgi:glucokinase
VGIGIGCKGIIEPKTTRVEVLPGTLHYLEGHLLFDLVAPTVPANVAVAADNDARVFLAGERAWGAARDHKNVLLLTLGTGVGGAILVDGRVLTGAAGVAGHLGHLTVVPDGEPCICGNRGCLETVFSARAIEAQAFALKHRGVASRLTEVDHLIPSCAEVFKLAEEGDEIARRVVSRATETLAGAIAGLLHLFDPEIVIIGGQIAEAGDALFVPLGRGVARRTRLLLRRDVPVVPSRLEDPSGVIGAAAHKR